MSKIGFIDLKRGNTFAIHGEITRLLQDKWLDYETVSDYETQVKHAIKDFNRMLSIKESILKEIKTRKKLYGETTKNG